MGNDGWFNRTPLHNLLWDRRSFTGCFFSNASQHKDSSWSSVQEYSLSYLKCHYFPVALCGRRDRRLTRPCRRGALLPAMHHCSPLRCLHPCLSETWRACLVFEQNCWTVSCNALLSYPAVKYCFWFLLGWFASKLRLHVYVLQWHAKRRAEICLSGYVFGKKTPILLSSNEMSL